LRAAGERLAKRHEKVFGWVLALVAERGLVKGQEP
jgi:hypothetical protein